MSTSKPRGGVGRALVRVAQLAPGSVVELQVAAARVVECLHGLAVCCGNIGEQQFLVVLVALDGACSGSSRTQQIRCSMEGEGMVCFTGVVAGDDALAVGEVLQERMVAEVNLVA